MVELFAGVGGFRVGFNNIKSFDENGKAIEDGDFKFVFANQWEPSTKTQHAFDCYNTRFPEKDLNSNVDIGKVDKASLPDHEVLCGGFPCQDYSVAHTLSKASGIEGKKGVLWWEINEILKAKRPPFVLLENVDRLVKSPAKQRGRDFGIMLRCFADLGYRVEWRIINAADYGHPQRRRRIYIFAYHCSTAYASRIDSLTPEDVFYKDGVYAKAFPVDLAKKAKINEFGVIEGYKDLVSVSNCFKASFENGGYMKDGIIYTTRLTPIYEQPTTLGEIIEHGVDEHFFLTPAQQKKFEFLRGSKKIKRIDSNGFEYFYSEGSMSPYDALNLPGRTMLTSEATVNRSSHIVLDPEKNRLRFLTPIECERLNQFPDDWTNTGMPEKRRYFMMGNALVCGIIRKIGIRISSIVDGEK